jgi:hypothetical protein
MQSLVQDLQFAFRMSLKNRSMSLIVILTFGLGIGLTTTVFSIVNGAMYKGLPFEDSHRIMALGRTNPSRGVEFMDVSAHDYADWREQQTAFEHLGAWGTSPLNLGLQEGRPQRLTGGLFTPSVFDVLQVQPVLGRPFLEEETRDGAEPVIIIGYDVWQDRFDGVDDIIGRTVRANGEIRTIVGVMPEGFAFPMLEQAWLPLDTDPGAAQRGEGPSFTALGKLREGVSLEEAQAQMAAIAGRLEQAYPESNEGIGADVRPFTDLAVGGVSPLLYTMLGAVFAVMLIACVNVANLLYGPWGRPEPGRRSAPHRSAAAGLPRRAAGFRPRHGGHRVVQGGHPGKPATLLDSVRSRLQGRSVRDRRDRACQCDLRCGACSAGDQVRRR